MLSTVIIEPNGAASTSRDTTAGLNIQPGEFDHRVVRLRLIQQGEVLARRITERIQLMKSDLTIIKEA